MIDAVSEIQQYHIMERTGQDVPSDFLTTKGTLYFFRAGMGSGLWEGALLAALLPVAWGVWEEAAPAFGTGASDPFGKCLVFFFAFGASAAMTAVVGGFLARYYRGPLTRKAIDSVAWGRAAGLAGTGAVVFFVFHALVLFASPENVYRFSAAAGFIFSDQDSLYSCIMKMKEPARKSALTQLLLSPVLGLAPFAALRIFGRGRGL